ncbi:regulatory protein RecX [Chitinophagaceae bacterium LWZ2-11]
MAVFKQKLTPEQAFQKLKHYCAYQERSHYEAQTKLYDLGLFKKEVEIVMGQLLEEGYLNEERYALQFAGGKFRIKHWGRVKIKYELKQKRVSEYNIRKALQSIDEEEYLKILQESAEKKWAALKGEQYINRQAKTMAFLYQRGFESALASEAIKKLLNNK